MHLVIYLHYIEKVVIRDNFIGIHIITNLIIATFFMWLDGTDDATISNTHMRRLREDRNFPTTYL